MHHRSHLFVPGNRPERFMKAYQSGTDMVIVDLEDAVSAPEKEEARESAVSWLSAEHPVYVRINAADTPWFERDVAALRQRPGVAGVVLPKAEDRGQLEGLARMLPGIPLVPLAETARGVWNVLELASAPQVRRLIFGSIDFQLDTGITGEDQELLYARSRLVLASRVARILPPLDGVTTALDTDDQLLADIERARRLGFGGKMCIHPRQVQAVNAGFGPTADEIAWAKGIVEATKSSGDGAIRVDGIMVDRPVIDKARKILERAQA